MTDKSTFSRRSDMLTWEQDPQPLVLVVAQFKNLTCRIADATVLGMGYIAVGEVRGPRGGITRKHIGSYFKTIEQAKSACEWEALREIDRAAQAAAPRQVSERQKEQKAQQVLARRVVDAGFKALAPEIHPDTGGSHDAMTRLNLVRDKLKRSV
jgi:hypothetical protein